MKTTVEALQAYYVELGGTASDVEDITTIPDMIDAITALGGGSGSSLPAVTSDDNGKLLTVVEGAWAKAKASGNDNIIDFTGNNFNSSNVGFTNLTFEENISDIYNSLNGDNFDKTILKGTDTANNTILFTPHRLTSTVAYFYYISVGNVAGTLVVCIHELKLEKTNETTTTNSTAYVLKNN